MEINVIELLNELVIAACQDFDNRSDISSESKWFLQHLRHWVTQYANENDIDNQKKMILIFLGSIVGALSTENSKYYNERRIYLGKADVKALYEDGKYVLADMPSYFCGQLFTLPFYDSADNNRELLLFPGLAEKTQEINYLVNFCILNQHDLNTPTFTVEKEDANYTLPTLRTIFDDKFQAFCDKKTPVIKKVARFLTFQEAPLLDVSLLAEEEIFALANTNSSDGRKVLSFLQSLKIVDAQGVPFENKYYSNERSVMVKNARTGERLNDENHQEIKLDM